MLSGKRLWWVGIVVIALALPAALIGLPEWLFIALAIGGMVLVVAGGGGTGLGG